MNKDMWRGKTVRPPVTACVASPVTGLVVEGGGGGTVPDASWTGYFNAAGINNDDARTAINTFYEGLATDGIQANVFVYMIFNGESPTSINLMEDNYHGALINSPTHTPWVGIRSDGATSYIDAGTILDDIVGVTTDNVLVGVSVAQDDPGEVGILVDYVSVEENAGGYKALAIEPSLNGPADEYQVYYALNDSWAAPPTIYAAWGDMTDIRLYVSRTGAAILKAYRGATEIGDSTEASVGVPQFSPFLCAYNSEGVPSIQTTSATFDMKSYVVADLDAAGQALLDARIATLNTALGALI